MQQAHHLSRQFHRPTLKLLLGLLLLLLGSTATQAQNAVSGRVLDANGNPVSGATVLVRGNNVFTFAESDSSGYWRFSSLPSARLEFYAAASNYGNWPAARTIDTRTTGSILLTLGSPTNAIAGGDFETQYRAVYWQQPNGGVSYSSDGFDGNYAARLGEGSATRVDCWQNGQSGTLWTLKQPVTIPNISEPGLSFVYKINTSQYSFDYAWLEVVLIDNGQPYYLTPWGQLWQQRDWEVESFDLSRWRGRTVDLLFQVARCSSQTLTASIDRVTIGSIPGAPDPGINTPNPGATPTPTPQYPTYGSSFNVSSRQLTACENAGKHHLFVRLRDANGVPMPGIRVRFRWTSGETIVTTGGKAEDPGLAELAMYPGTYWVSLPDFGTGEAGPFTPNIPENQVCDTTGEIGNSLYHYSYEIIYRQTQSGYSPTPTPTPISVPADPNSSYRITRVSAEVNEAITQIRGIVRDRNGNPVSGARVRVRIGDFCTTSVPSGTPGVYPPGEYDVLLRNYASDGNWLVAMVDRPIDSNDNRCDSNARLLSPEIEVQTTNREGVVYVDFQQN